MTQGSSPPIWGVSQKKECIVALIKLKIYAETLQTKTNITVILPSPSPKNWTGEAENPFPYYSDSLRCPVLYLLHGTYGDEDDWIRFSRIESYAQLYNLAVVMPGAANSWFNNMPQGGPAYYDYITGELPEIINWTFPVSPKREDTFIAGLSMGGSGAFKLAMTRPETYGCAALLSAGLIDLDPRLAGGNTVWSLAFQPGEKTRGTENDPYWLAEDLIKRKVAYPKLYICCGTEDFLYQDNLRFREHLDRIGFKYTWHEQPGIHDFNFWDAGIQRILEWLPIKRREMYP
jgi:S-formylglutathione hydrolase FrmB